MNSLIEQLQKRKVAITVPLALTLPMDFSGELCDVWSNFEVLRNNSNDFTKALETEQKKARDVLRLKEVADFIDLIDYESICKHIETLKSTVESEKIKEQSIRDAIRDKEELIKVKKRQLNDEEKGALKVNQYLNSFFGCDGLSLQASEDLDEGEKKIRFVIVRNGKRAYHLSEGECSLIAFCYFMAKLDDVYTKNTRPIIWIDDPISSLDSNHIFFLYTLIASELTDSGNFEQLFISTHNLDFLKYLKRINGKFLDKDNGYPKAYFIVTREGHTSSIKVMPRYMKKYITEFNYLFHEIHKCSSIETVDDDNYPSFYNFGNNARKFLELLLFFKYPDNTDEREKMEKFFGEGRVPVFFTERISNEYSHLCGNVERASVPVEVPEMRSVAELIINKLKEDEDQYNALMNSIIS